MERATQLASHRFQGDERDVMIFSPVVSRAMPQGASIFLRKTGNLVGAVLVAVLPFFDLCVSLEDAEGVFPAQRTLTLCSPLPRRVLNSPSRGGVQPLEQTNAFPNFIAK